MPCFYPLTAWYSKNINPSGKRSLVFSPNRAMWADKPLEIACGQCGGCRLERSRQWAVRCMHEAHQHEYNSFVTLTFSEPALYSRENPYTVSVRDHQLFMKRLRKKYGQGIRFYLCGEYGEVCRKCALSRAKCGCNYFYASIGRPHYHVCLFGFDFPDKKFWKYSPTGDRLYISDSLNDLWPYGFGVIGSVSFQSAAYVARYIMKKQNGENLKKVDEFGLKPYERMCLYTGEIYDCAPEYTKMSLKPGIGMTWFEKYKDDVYPHDYVVVNGVKCRPPKFYDTQLEKFNPYIYEDVKLKRKINMNKREIEVLKEYGRSASVYKSKRRDDALRCHKARMRLLSRKL